MPLSLPQALTKAEAVVVLIAVGRRAKRASGRGKAVAGQHLAVVQGRGLLALLAAPLTAAAFAR